MPRETQVYAVFVTNTSTGEDASISPPSAEIRTAQQDGVGSPCMCKLD